MTPITDKIKQLPDGRRLIIELPMQTYEDTNLTTDDLKALVVVVEDAVRLGQEQAKEWDRFWDAIGCLSSEITVDDAIAKYQALVSELDRKTRALERTRGAIRSVLPHFESHQVYDKGSEAILQEALND